MVCGMYYNYCLVVQIKFYECFYQEEEEEQRESAIRFHSLLLVNTYYAIPDNPPYLAGRVPV